MPTRYIWAEIGQDGRVISLFRNHHQAVLAEATRHARIQHVLRTTAVSEIRTQVFDRQLGQCLHCPKRFTLQQMHLHEKQHRGEGGQISLENSIGLCADCHLNGEHGDRKPRFGEDNYDARNTE